MPKHTFKPVDPYGGLEAAPKKPKKRLPRQHFHDLPTSLVNEAKVGEDVTITIKGKVTGLSTREDFSEKEGSLDVEMKSIEVYGSNEFSEMAKDDG